MASLRICLVALFLCLLSHCGSLKTTDNSKPSAFDRFDAISEFYEKSAIVRQSVCPHWTYNKYHNSSCVCGSSRYGTIICKDSESLVRILTCHCMSRSESSKSGGIVEGMCPYLCTNGFYTDIEPDFDFFKDDLCNKVISQNRTGQLCGRCKEGHAPSAYSYSFMCADCTDYRHNWIKYVAIAYVPITLLYILVITFRLSALSASMNATIFISQIFSCPAVMSMLSVFVYYSEKSPVDQNHIDLKLAERAIAVIYGVWNLDFFHLVFQPLCIHPNINILHIIALDYGVAFYPIVLILLTYVMVKLHDRIVLLQSICSPIVKLLLCCSREWKVSSFFIETFGTFFLLSYVKVVNTSFAILMPVWVRNVTGDTVGTFLYYNGTMRYFGPEHRPFMFLAVFMFTTFNLLPLLLLCLYPCRCFQSCLNCCRLNSQVLRTFMDAFQGCYKFEPYDCRYWAGFYLFLRIAMLVIFAFTQTAYFILIAGLFMMFVSCITAVVRPYKQTAYNVLEIVMFLIFSLVASSLTLVSMSAFDQRYFSFASSMTAVLLILPPLYLVGFLITKLTKQLISSVKLIRDSHLRNDISEEQSLLQDNNRHMEEYN